MDCASTLLNFRVAIHIVSYVNGALCCTIPEYSMNGAPWRCAT